MDEVTVKVEEVEVEYDEWSLDGVKEEIDIEPTQLQRVEISHKPLTVKSEPSGVGSLENYATSTYPHHLQDHTYALKPTHRERFAGRKFFSKNNCNENDTSTDQSENELEEQVVYTVDEPNKCAVRNEQYNARSSSALAKRPVIRVEEKTYKKSPMKGVLCPVCNKRFVCYSALTLHTRIHTGEKPYECTVCKKRFTQSSTLEEHMMIHTGQKPFICFVCNKRFTKSRKLIEHGRIHTGEKPFECTVCNKRFFQRGSLITHMKIHTEGKVFECKFCNKRFSRNSTLAQHVRIHTGEKPYECTVCFERFTFRSSLGKHRKIHTENYDRQ